MTATLDAIDLTAAAAQAAADKLATQIIAAAERRAGRSVGEQVVLRQYHPGTPGPDARQVPVGERPPAAQHLDSGGGSQ